MGITLSQIAANTASVTFQYDILHEDGSRESTPVTVAYYPGRVTEKALAQLQGFSSLSENTMVAGFTAFNETLAHLIKSWDVFEDDAQAVMFPIDASRLAELPVAFRMQVIDAIMGNIRPEMIAPQTA